MNTKYDDKVSEELESLVTEGPAGEFLEVPTAGVYEDGPPKIAPRGHKYVPHTRAWEDHEFIRIDGKPYQYTIDRSLGTVLHLPGRGNCPLIDFPLLFGRNHRIEVPRVLRLSPSRIYDEHDGKY